LILVEPATELRIAIAKPKKARPYRATGVGEAQLDDLELLYDDANEAGGSNQAVGLDVLDQDSVKVGDQLGAGGERRGPMRMWRRREAQVSSSDLEDLSEQALIQRPGLVTAVLPAGEADPKRGIGGKLEAIEAGSLAYGP
jgi:hypothetical protein